VGAVDDDSNRAVEPNQPSAQPDLPGCGPGGRGFESRRSPSEVPANQQVAPSAGAADGPPTVQFLAGTRGRGGTTTPARRRGRALRRLQRPVGEPDRLARPDLPQQRRGRVRLCVGAVPPLPAGPRWRLAWLAHPGGQREAWRLHALEVEHDHLGSATESEPVRWTEPEDPRDQYSLRIDLDEAMEP
jgi:hypothetical protein